MIEKRPHLAVVGGGPAGLRAAEVASAAGARVSLFEGKPAPGRKFLVAGYGGLNLTHGETLEKFAMRYSGSDLPPDFFAKLLAEFSPIDLRTWAAGLGIETFEQRTGRVYPKAMKAAPLLRAWLARLRTQGVEFFPRHLLTEIRPDEGLIFNNDEKTAIRPDAVVLALGGASWPRTGSDGGWTRLFPELKISAFESANCGWECPWPQDLIPQIEGQPLKNIVASAGKMSVRGEVMLTRYGLEGGALYQLGPALRAQKNPCLRLDLKPDQSAEILQRKMESVRRDFLTAAGERWKLPKAARALLGHFHGDFSEAKTLAQAVKNLQIPLGDPRPLAEAISSAGGLAWSELDENLMLKKRPGIFLAGEMIDWEAPTGGYLMQGCFATGNRAAHAALKFCERAES